MTEFHVIETIFRLVGLAIVFCKNGSGPKPCPPLSSGFPGRALFISEAGDSVSIVMISVGDGIAIPSFSFL